MEKPKPKVKGKPRPEAKPSLDARMEARRKIIEEKKEELEAEVAPLVEKWELYGLPGRLIVLGASRMAELVWVTDDGESEREMIEAVLGKLDLWCAAYLAMTEDET